MRRLLCSLFVAGCYSANPQAGAPCDDEHPCPQPLVCTANVCAKPGGEIVDATPCVPTGREVCGNGIDEDCDGSDPGCPANDTPDSPPDVSAGGTFMVDLTYANDNATATGGGFCGGMGGRDVYFSIDPPGGDEVYYLDTFGSDFDTVLRVYHTSCTSLSGFPTCRNNSCNLDQSQYAGTMDAVGGNCIIVDQDSMAETNGHLVLHVERGMRNGTGMSGGTTVTGDTCSGLNNATGTCGGGGPNINYFITACPGSTRTLTASTCNAATVGDSVLEVLGPSGQLACAQDDGLTGCVSQPLAATVTNVALSGAHLFWLVADSTAQASCGAYTLTTTLN